MGARSVNLEFYLRSRYKVRERRVSIGPFDFSLLGPETMDALITPDTDPERLPYWADLWPSAYGLAQWIWDFRGELKGPLLELGAGLGLPGLVAGKVGFWVLQTDYEEPAMAFARLNAHRNRVKTVQQVVMDWRSPSLKRPFPTVIGSDILYAPELHSALGHTLGHLLVEGGRLLISDPWRSFALDFIALLEEGGWSFRLWEVPTDQGVILVYDGVK